MRIAMADAMSVDSKITDGSSTAPQTWASTEDAEHFKLLREQYDTIVMGRKTYDAIRPRPSPDKLRIVLTHHASNYAEQAHPGALEFTDQAVPLLVETLRARGRNNVLVAGGGEINRLFLESGFVDELFVTIEPVVLGRGTEFVPTASALATNLTLESVQQLNQRGTLFLHYLVAHDADQERVA